MDRLEELSIKLMADLERRRSISTPGCISDQRLIDYYTGDLLHNEWELIDQHLAGCLVCMYGMVINSNQSYNEKSG